MATVLNHSKQFRKKQGELEKKQREVFGMSSDTDLDFNKAVIVFPDKIPEAEKLTYEQNGRNEVISKELMPKSPVKKYYEKNNANNTQFIEKAKKVK